MIEEDVRATWGWTWFEQFLRDVHFGLRQMRHNPAFSAVAIPSLALGIGANTAISSLCRPGGEATGFLTLL